MPWTCPQPSKRAERSSQRRARLCKVASCRNLRTISRFDIWQAEKAWKKKLNHDAWLQKKEEHAKLREEEKLNQAASRGAVSEITFTA